MVSYRGALNIPNGRERRVFAATMGTAAPKRSPQQQILRLRGLRCWHEMQEAIGIPTLTEDRDYLALSLMELYEQQCPKQ